MNMFEFIVGMTDALIWPFVLLSIFLILRHPLSKAIGRMRSFRHGEIELAFEDELEDISRAALEGGITIFRPVPVPAPTASGDPFEGSSKDPWGQVDGFTSSPPSPPSPPPSPASPEPRQEVIQRWDRLEAELNRAAQALGAEAGSVQSGLNALRRSKAMRASEIEIVEDLYRMRNKAAHDLESRISKEDAKRFAMIATSMTERLAQAKVEQ